MNLNEKYGWLVFFLVPILLWLLAGGAAMWKGRKSPFLAYIAGSDNRLSLSRLQAFLWTLVIFGAFAAAMAVHSKMIVGTKEEVEQATKAKTTADKAAADSKTAAENAESEAQNAANKLTLAQGKATRATEESNKGTTTEEKSAALKAATDAQAEFNNAASEKTAADNKATTARAVATRASEDQKKASLEASRYQWVIIPAGLLALAGIAVGSGVFSGFISASNSEGKTACVTQLVSNDRINRELVPKGNEIAYLTGLPTPASGEPPFSLVIHGQKFGTGGRVRFDGRSAPILFWGDELIAVDVPLGAKLNPLVVETANGKVSYRLEGEPTDFSLGLPIVNYEFIDLFRDDKNPQTLDTMKFQMFGWTLIAILIYGYLFLTSISTTMMELPSVPESIVVLTGLSQGGYLAGKVVSNVNKPS